jgi:hypothetical protein
MRRRACPFVINALQLVPTLLLADDVRKSRLATVPALLPVFNPPGTTPADNDTPSNTSPPATPEKVPTPSIAERTKAEKREAAPVPKIDTAQLRGTGIWAHNIARKLFQRSSLDEASSRFRHRT